MTHRFICKYPNHFTTNSNVRYSYARGPTTSCIAFAHLSTVQSISHLISPDPADVDPGMGIFRPPWSCDDGMILLRRPLIDLALELDTRIPEAAGPGARLAPKTLFCFRQIHVEGKGIPKRRMPKHLIRAGILAPALHTARN